MGGGGGKGGVGVKHLVEKGGMLTIDIKKYIRKNEKRHKFLPGISILKLTSRDGGRRSS